MSTKILRAACALVGGAAAVAAAVPAAGPASAHPAPFTVTAGSAPAGTTVRVTATSPNGVSLRDTSTGITASCRSVSVRGTLQTGVRSAGAKVIAFDGRTAVFDLCIGPPSARYSFTGIGTWYLNVSDSSGGIATGTLSNVTIAVKAETSTVCSFSLGASTGAFTGTVSPATVPQTYTNSTRQVRIAAANPGQFGMWNVNGGNMRPNYCIAPSVYRTGDKMSVSMSLELRGDVAAYNPIAIT